MAMEEDFTRKVSNVDTVDVTRYGLGARGIDYIQKIAGANLQNPVTSEAYPVYDGHGNMVATLAKSTTLPTLANQRTYDAWGAVRAGSTTGEPKGRYVANLGHVQDDESGLIYMRARYYEPGLGRFVGEDRARQSLNWFSYCDANPINLVDRSGTTAEDLIAGTLLAGVAFTCAFFGMLYAADNVLGSLMMGAGGLSFAGAAILMFYRHFAGGHLPAGGAAMGTIVGTALFRALGTAAEAAIKSYAPLSRFAGFLGYGLGMAMTVALCSLIGSLLSVQLGVEQG